MPHVDVRHDASCYVKNTTEIKPVLISALCDAHHRRWHAVCECAQYFTCVWL